MPFLSVKEGVVVKKAADVMVSGDSGAKEFTASMEQQKERETAHSFGSERLHGTTCGRSPIPDNSLAIVIGDNEAKRPKVAVSVSPAITACVCGVVGEKREE